ncbi:hypothetical protein [Synechococcus sp. BS56D]|uniref:hypothetical protein n=1 Tax=Synechococcus sp. BS56D TaxID=2055944 RepID=UPI00103DDA31|nr:hypothetical protein [Synechococcus sp. BS56D]
MTFRGISGYSLELITGKNGCKYIRKISPNIMKNSRLIFQCGKLREWAHSSVRVPRVLSDGFTTEGFYFYEMEYIKAKNAAQLLKDIMYPNKVDTVVWDGFEDRITQYLSSGGYSFSNFEQRNIALLVDLKFTSLLSANQHIFIALGQQDLYTKLSSLSSLSSIYKINYTPLEDTNSATPSKGHGDMSLGNILVLEDGLCFVDLDRHYLDVYPYLADSLKLTFDLESSHSLLIESETSSLTHSVVSASRTSNLIRKIESCIHIDPLLLNRCLLVEALRVLPYKYMTNLDCSHTLAYIINKASVNH